MRYDITSIEIIPRKYKLVSDCLSSVTSYANGDEYIRNWLLNEEWHIYNLMKDLGIDIEIYMGIYHSDCFKKKELGVVFLINNNFYIPHDLHDIYIANNYKEMEEKKDILYLEWSRASRKRRELETVRNAILAFNNNHEE